MVLAQSSFKVSLPSSVLDATTVIFERNSRSLALTHSDSSVSLFPSLPSLSCLPSEPQIVIPPPLLASSFLLLKQNQENHADDRIVFMSAAPNGADDRLVLKFYVLQMDRNFSNVPVFSNQKGISSDTDLSLLIDVGHEAGIMLVASCNFFVLHSASSKKLWVFGVKLICSETSNGVVQEKLKFMRCAVIDCCSPVWSASIFFHCLILGEDGGTRVFNLRQLIKGKTIDAKNPSYSNGPLCSSKTMPTNCRRESADCSGYFIKLMTEEEAGGKSESRKFISIHALTSKKYILLDSSGKIFVLDLFNSPNGGRTHRLRLLPLMMKGQKIAVSPEDSARTHTVWVSDGLHSIHKLSLPESDDTSDEFAKFSVVIGIFTGEQVLDMVPISATAISVLQRGSICVYAVP